jgi:hypothetical protein
MPTPAILNQVAGYMAKVEATYGTAETLTAGSDGIFPYLGDGLPQPPTALEYLFDGSIGRSVSSLLPLARVAPNGRGRKQDFPVLFKGAGTTYSGSVKPPREVDLLLQAAGFDGTYSTKWDYTPTAAGTGYKSLTVGTYAQGKAQVMAGALADWSFAFDNLGCPVHTFNLQGIGALPTTLSLPTITYQYTSIVPPVAAGATVTIGTWTAPVVKSGKFALNRSIGNARARITTAGGHLGFVPGMLDPQMTFMVEQTALVASPFHTTGGLDPDNLREAATGITVSIQIGSTSTNRYTVTLNNAQLIQATPQNDDAVAMWELTFRGSGSTAVAVTFD